MRICVFGASGRTGQLVVEKALDEGNQVVALGKNLKKLTKSHEGLEVKEVDVLNPDELVPEMEGCDAVVSCIGHPVTFFAKQTLYSESCKSITQAMRKAGVERLITMTAWCRVYCPSYPWLREKFLKTFLIGRNMADMHRMETYLEENCSDISWTCVKVPGLDTDERPARKVILVIAEYPRGMTKEIRMPRDAVAKFMVSQLSSDEWVRKMVAIGLEKTLTNKYEHLHL